MLEKIAYIGLGSNLGERKGFIKKALAMLDEERDLTVCQVSSIVETEPLGGLDQPKYLNAVAEIKTSLDARKLLECLRKIENDLGRVRQGAMSSRTIDLDILFFEKEIINEPELTVPHPRMHLRSFVLCALSELNPDLVHPVLKHSISELASRLHGMNYIVDPNMPQLISTAGMIGVGKTTLSRNLAQLFDSKLLLEAYDTNPFLAKVYAGQKELALDSQLYFLSSRVEQIGRDTLKAGQIAITDYVFDKDRIYARRLLDAQQHSLYLKIHDMLIDKICRPVVLIYLKDTPANCLARIHKRNRPYEQSITIEFLQTQCDDYEELIKSWTHCPVITINVSEFDCRDINKAAKLAQEIKSYIAVK